MPDRYDQLQSYLCACRQECAARTAEAEQFASLAAQLESAGKDSVALALRSCARHSHIKALELQGQIAAFRYEQGWAPYLDF